MSTVGSGELAQQNLKLHAEVLARVTDGVNVVSGNDGRILFVNQAMEDMFGYTAEELVGQHPAMLNACSETNSPEAVAADIFSALQNTGGWRGDLLNRRKNGSLFWTNTTITRHEIAPWGTVWLGIQRDVSARKRQEDELARQRALLESSMHATDVMLVLLDTGFNFLWVNEAYARTCGMPPEAMVGRSHFALYPHAENEAIFRQVRDTGTGVFFKDKPFEFPDQPERGITFWDWSLAPVKDAVGKVTGLVFSLRETTPYKRIELALENSEQRYRTLVEQVPDGIFVADASGRYTDVNPAGAAMLGYSRDEVLSLTIADIIVPEEVQRLPEELSRFVDASVVRSEWRFRRKDGSSFFGEVHGRRLPDGRLQGVLRDISDRRQAEDERLATLARQRDTLIQEVHHRIKNHLHGVMGLLSAEAAAHPALAAPLAETAAQINAIATVYGLHASRNLEPVELGQMIGLLVKSAAGPVPVECHFSATPITVAETVSVSLALVINELITNALKHLDRPDPQRPVRVTLDLVGTTVRLEVCGGPARLPADFDFERQHKTGLGLELVNTLLSNSDTRLCYEQRCDEVCATLWLKVPAIPI